ncbi:ExbD/TolR family protein [Marinimicrobium alkaliphilum]|uniref:ExbD/TolR family protein n=1 Tax=Marinimicrobium alkaliphilum TaxID=2202654 RepID=UPI001300434E|nr:biopolymer transporter ExbD [Marinimicrobium alkaliphilum]
MTPLIDVVFILLIFFMLASRMTPFGLINLDTEVAPGEPQTTQIPDLLHLHIAVSGELLLDGNNQSAEQVRAALTQFSGERVRISTDPETPLSAFTLWLGEVRAQGLEPQWRREP